MRKWIALCAFGMLLASPVRANTYVGSVSLDYDPAQYSSGFAGELQAHLHIATGPFVVANQSAAAEIGGNSSTADPSNPIFQTFCIQEGVNNVDAIPGQLYAAVIGTSAQTYTSPPPEYLNPVTQVLYAEFWNGTLPGYNYAGIGAGRISTAGQLQDAIWHALGDDSFAGAMGLAGISDTVLAEAWYNAAANYVLHGTHSAFLGNPNGAGDVMILGLYDTKEHALAGGIPGIAQAQLVEVVPVPPAIWGGLALLGCIGAVRVIKRRTATA